MSARAILLAMIILLLGVAAGVSATDSEADKNLIAEIETSLAKLSQQQAEIEDIHPFLSILQPIAILEKDHLYIFETEPEKREYRFVKKAPVPFPLSPGIRAAFPLSVNDGKPTCIVSGEIFDDPDGFVTFFHEFMHCHQSNTCEYSLKSTLEISRRAAENKDYTWELNHKFPYQDPVFVKNYTGLLRALDEGEVEAAKKHRTILKQHLEPVDYEYMVWQGWKEGFARLIENRILAHYGFDRNDFGQEAPFDRIVFYTGGERFIDYLARNNKELLVDIESLFSHLQAFPDVP